MLDITLTTMNNKISDLNTHKQKKKVQTVVKELNTIIAIYNIFLSTLKKYGKYTLVSEVISLIAQNKTLLTIQLNKYKKILEDIEDGKLEKTK